MIRNNFQHTKTTPYEGGFLTKVPRTSIIQQFY